MGNRRVLSMQRSVNDLAHGGEIVWPCSPDPAPWCGGGGGVKALQWPPPLPTTCQSHRSPHSVRGKLQPHCLSVTTLAVFSRELVCPFQMKWWHINGMTNLLAQNDQLVAIEGFMQTHGCAEHCTSASDSENSLSTQQPLRSSTFYLPLVIQISSIQILIHSI